TWNNIGFVKSKANNYKSVSIIAYNFTDNDINAPYYFYRLRQTDLDGKVTFSTIRKVSFYNNSLSEINIYPNPTSGLAHIDKLTGNETINIIELTGKIMLRIEAMSGVNKIDVSSLTQGIYFIEISDKNGNVERRKLTI